MSGAVKRCRISPILRGLCDLRAWRESLENASSQQSALGYRRYDRKPLLPWLIGDLLEIMSRIAKWFWICRMQCLDVDLDMLIRSTGDHIDMGKASELFLSNA